MSGISRLLPSSRFGNGAECVRALLKLAAFSAILAAMLAAGALALGCSPASQEGPKPDVGVALMENGNQIAYGSYFADDDVRESESGELLSYVDEQVMPGRVFDEDLVVSNTGKSDVYVRVELTRKWMDADGREAPDADVSLIELELSEEGWHRSAESAAEGIEVFYLDGPLPAGESSQTLLKSMRISPEAAYVVSQSAEPKDGGTVVSTTYLYNGYAFKVTAKVDAVQAEDGQSAESAFGDVA